MEWHGGTRSRADAGGWSGHGWPDEDEPGAAQQPLVGLEPKGKPPKRAPRNGQRWKVLVEKFAEGAGAMFLRDDALIDRGAIVALNRLVDDLRAGGVTQADVRQAGEIVRDGFEHPITVRWLMRAGNLMDLVTRARRGPEAGGRQVRKFKVR